MCFQCIYRDNTYAQVNGRVIDENGNPIAEAMVEIQKEVAKTNELGRFQIDIPFDQQRRQQRIRVSKVGYQTWDRREPIRQRMDPIPILLEWSY